jgi:hypothetical protein
VKRTHTPEIFHVFQSLSFQESFERSSLKPREGRAMIKPHEISNKAAAQLERQHRTRMKKMRGTNLVGGKKFGQLGRVGKGSKVRVLAGEALEARKAEIEARARSEGAAGPAHLHDVITAKLKRQKAKETKDLRERVLGKPIWPSGKRAKKRTIAERPPVAPLRKCESQSEDVCRALVCPRHRGRLAYCPWARNGHVNHH